MKIFENYCYLVPRCIQFLNENIYNFFLISEYTWILEISSCRLHNMQSTTWNLCSAYVMKFLKFRKNAFCYFQFWFYILQFSTGTPGRLVRVGPSSREKPALTQTSLYRCFTCLLKIVVSLHLHNSEVRLTTVVFFSCS